MFYRPKKYHDLNKKRIRGITVSEKEREKEVKRYLKELNPTASDLIEYLETMKNIKWFEDFTDWLLAQRNVQAMQKLEQLKKRK